MFATKGIDGTVCLREAGHVRDQAAWDARASAASQRPLLGSNGQRIEFTMVWARAAAALRRVMERSDADERDRAALHDAETVLRSAADAIEFVSSGGQLGQYPDAANFGAVTATLEVAVTDTVTASEVAPRLRAIADKFSELESSPTPTSAERLLEMSSGLADAAMRDAGWVGESPAPV